MTTKKPLRIKIAETHIETYRKYIGETGYTRTSLLRESEGYPLECALSGIGSLVVSGDGIDWLVEGLERSVKEYDALSFAQKHLSPKLREALADDDQYEIFYAQTELEEEEPEEIIKPLRIKIASTHIDELRRFRASEIGKREFLYRECQRFPLEINFADLRFVVDEPKEVDWMLDGIKRGIDEYDALPFTQQQTPPELRKPLADDDQYDIRYAQKPPTPSFQIPLLHRFNIDEAKMCLDRLEVNESWKLRRFSEHSDYAEVFGKRYNFNNRWDFLAFYQALDAAIGRYEPDSPAAKAIIKHEESLNWLGRFLFRFKRTFAR